MALTLRIKHFEVQSTRWKGDKVATSSFRGVSHVSGVLEESGNFLVLDQRVEWPLARPVERQETLRVELVSRGRLLGVRLIGSYTLVLQGLVSEEGVRRRHLSLTDTLVDLNNRPIQATVTFEVGYLPPLVDVPRSVSKEQTSTATPSPPPPPPSASTATASTPRLWNEDTSDDDRQMLVDIERNIANLERSMSVERRNSHSRNATGSISAPESPPSGRKRSSTLRSVRSLMRLGKQRPSRGDEQRKSLLTRCASEGDSRRMQPADIAVPSSRKTSDIAPIKRPASQTSLSSDSERSEQMPAPAQRNQPMTGLTPSALKAQDFQVCITVIEARQLAGLNMDPVVCVQIGDQKKYTSVKESTNCPYYNEYFVFDFHMPPVMLFDKIITLSVFHSRKLLRSGTIVGSFKIDLKTVYDAPGINLVNHLSDMICSRK